MRSIKNYAFHQTNNLDRFASEFIKCNKLS